MNLAIISFTKAGSILNNKVASLLQNEHTCNSFYKGRCEEGLSLTEVTASLNEWCQNIFVNVDGIIFIGACGIAVRTIAPFIEDKTKDPLVLVIDEKAQFVISLLSGHIGGGNDLASIISELLNATPVITTATDVNHKFAVDVFASKENLCITDMKLAKEISASILDGQQIGFVSRLPIIGEIPEEFLLRNKDVSTESNSREEDTSIYNKEENAQTNNNNREENKKIKLGICISYDEKENPFENTLNLIPRIITIGVGCKKNIDVNSFEEYILKMIRVNDISIHSIKNIASIDLKMNETCITSFATKYKIPFMTFSAEELNEVSGDFEESEFVKSITGVGNVCERSALLGSNMGELIFKKQSHNGMTIALAKETRGISFE